MRSNSRLVACPISGIEISAKTVRKLHKVTVWPENLAISTPQFASLFFTI
jgi:hypothetical protein